MGPIETVDGLTGGGVDWHSPPRFRRPWSRHSGALVSWHANWMGPGRWGVQVITPERRLILAPIEQLRVQDHGSFAEHPIEIDTSSDGGCKPGLLGRVTAFLTGAGIERLPTLDERTLAEFRDDRTGRWNRGPGMTPDDQALISEQIERAWSLANEGSHIPPPSRCAGAFDGRRTRRPRSSPAGDRRPGGSGRARGLPSSNRSEAAGDRQLVVLADSLGLPRPDDKVGPTSGAERTYPMLLLDRLPGHGVNSFCQRYFTTETSSTSCFRTHRSG